MKYFALIEKLPGLRLYDERGIRRYRVWLSVVGMITLNEKHMGLAA